MASQYRDAFEDLSPKLSSVTNPYVQKLLTGKDLGQLPVIFGQDLRGLRGQWRQRISDQFPSHPKPFRSLIVEIGCHKGKTLLEMAEAHPDIAFVGIDITFKRVALTAERVVKKRLQNVLVVLGSAKQFREFFAPQELSGIVAFYPDPWTKKTRQIHHQLFTQEFCLDLSDTLERNGFFWFKSDSESYFNKVSTFADAAKLIKAQAKIGIYGETYQSSFETFFAKQSLPCHEAVWVKGPRS
jgi:tRNA (guanine-N7-)-methyltransferase